MLHPSFRTVLESNRRWLALAVVVTAQFMVVLDIAIVNVALPSIERDVGFSPADLQWVISAYAILFGGFLLLGGRLADVLGRRRVFAAGLALFTVSSFLCGLAWSEMSLVAFRAVQGLGGALLAPSALSILMTTFSEGRERNLALGIWGAASGSGGAAGVLLGGFLTSWLSWSWVFFINVPVGALVLALSPKLLDESRTELRRRYFDVGGSGSITAGLMLFVYALTRTSSTGWSDATTLLLLAGSAVLVGAFVAIELLSPAPLLPLRIFRRRTLAAANAIAFLVGAMAFSQFFVLTLYSQQVLHYSAMKTGATFAATTAAIVLFANVGQSLVTRFGVRPVLTAGLLLVAASFGDLALLPEHARYLTDLLPAYVVSGLGMAFTFVPMTIAGLAGVPEADSGVASGLINTTRQIGGAVGLAAVSTIAVTSAGASSTHGYRTAFLVLTALALAGSAIAAAFLGPAGRPAVFAPAPEHDVFDLKEAA